MTFFDVQIAVHRDGEHLWAECPACAGWTAAADSWDDLFALIVEWHTGKHGWFAIEPWRLSEGGSETDG